MLYPKMRLIWYPQLFFAFVPVKATVDALCRRDANLFTDDVAIIFMLEDLKMLTTYNSKITFSPYPSHTTKENRYQWGTSVCAQ